MIDIGSASTVLVSRKKDNALIYFVDFLGGGFKLFFHPYLGKIPVLTSIFQMGWFNHQPVLQIF